MTAVEFEAYVAAQRRALCRFAGVLSGDPVLADELVSDILGVAFERWSQVSAADNVHAYVRRMVLNEYLGWRRRSARVAASANLEDVASPLADHADAYADRHRLLTEMKLLPAKQRAAIVLRYYEGLPFAEIAELLDSGENAVRSNISRGLARLRIQLADEQTDAGFPAEPNFVEASS